MDYMDTVTCDKCGKSYECDKLMDDYGGAMFYDSGRRLGHYNEEEEELICDCGNKIVFYFTSGIEAMTWNDTLEIHFSYGVKEEE